MERNPIRFNVSTLRSIGEGNPIKEWNGPKPSRDLHFLSWLNWAHVLTYGGEKLKLPNELIKYPFAANQ